MELSQTKPDFGPNLFAEGHDVILRQTGNGEPVFFLKRNPKNQGDYITGEGLATSVAKIMELGFKVDPKNILQTDAYTHENTLNPRGTEKSSETWYRSAVIIASKE